MDKMNILRLLFSIELVLFIIGIVAYTILLRIIRTSKKERLTRLFSAGQKHTLDDIKGKVIRSAAKLKKIKIELFISTGVLVIALLCLWYLNEAQRAFSLIGIMIIIPLPFCILFLEYFFRKVAERIKELANL